MSTEQVEQQIQVSPDRKNGQRRFFRLNEIITEQTAANRSLIAILQAVQEEYRYLPEEVLTYIATALDLSPATVFGVATFFAQFSLEPKGRYLVTVCDGTACHVKRSMAVYDAICRKYDLREGKLTTPDMLFTLETVACVGCCALAPVMIVNGEVHARITREAAVT
ncbi:NADH-quinone oxidoreductase subunit NuoE family protein, partial [Candidatus Hakubella thermalkaliphila]